jgi:O-antigen ligase
VAATATARAPLTLSFRERLDTTVRGSPSLPFLLIAVGILVWFSADEGGFLGTTHLPAALAMLAMLIVALVALPTPTPPRPLQLAMALTAGYAAWSYLSMAWAGQPDVAWEGANKTALYALVFALFALWPVRGNAAAFLAGAFALGVTGVAIVELFRIDGTSRTLAFFHEGRLAEPAGYANANAAMWAMAFWPAALLAGRREVPVILRGLLLGSAGILVALALLAQSRGWLMALPFMVVIAVVAVPGRGRTLVTLAAVAAAAALMVGPITDVYDAFDPSKPPGQVFSDALSRILLVSALLAVAGLVAALVDRRVRVPAPTARRVSRAVVVAAAAVALLGGGVVVARADDPLGSVSDRWKEFKKGGTEPTFTSSRLSSSSFASYRADAWTVAWDSFKRHPVIGVGADNFARDYALHGDSDQTPKYPHSLEFRVISQTGVIGLLLFGGALAAAVMAAAPAVRRGRGIGAAAAGTGLMIGAYWVVHGSLDWFFEYPVLSCAAFAFLGLAGAVSAGMFPTRARPLPGGRPLAIGAVVLASALSGAIAIPWLAERDLRNAREQAGADPQGALDRLDRSGRLNRLSPDAHKTSALIELRQGNLAAARRDFQEAVERSPGDSFALIQLAAIASVETRRADARALVARARAAAPRDSVVRRAARAINRDGVVTPQKVNQLVLQDIDVRIGPGN